MHRVTWLCMPRVVQVSSTEHRTLLSAETYYVLHNVWCMELTVLEVKGQLMFSTAPCGVLRGAILRVSGVLGRLYWSSWSAYLAHCGNTSTCLAFHGMLRFGWLPPSLLTPGNLFLASRTLISNHFQHEFFAALLSRTWVSIVAREVLDLSKDSSACIIMRLLEPQGSWILFPRNDTVSRTSQETLNLSPQMRTRDVFMWVITLNFQTNWRISTKLCMYNKSPHVLFL
jgi:hypothetical protein